jgi:hypothetical protein
MLGFDTVFIYVKDRPGLDRMIIGFATTCVQSEPITTKVVSSNPVHGVSISYICRNSVTYFR